MRRAGQPIAMETIEPSARNTGLPAHRQLGFRLAVVRWTGPSVLSLPSFGSGIPAPHGRQEV